MVTVKGVKKCLPPCPIPGQSYDNAGICQCPSGESVVDGRCQPECKYVAGTMTYTRDTTKSGTKSMTTTGTAKTLTCIDTMLKQCSAKYGVSISRNTTASGSSNYDDYMLICWSYTIDELKHLPPGTTHSQMVSAWNNGENPTVTFIMDENCNPVTSVPKPGEVCGTVNVTTIASPISLLWEAGADINRSVSVSSFPLDPKEQGMFYSWKASAEAPLLVHDPAHTGVIKTAHQLFGEWTFGGKSVASAKGAGPVRTAWKNGYEALATLDWNKDGQVSGVELVDLGLWFDRNRNGVSEEGEVVSLVKAEVTALFYETSRTDSLRKDIYADRGFERLVDGERVIGASVDWYGEQALTPVELGLKAQLRSTLSGGVPDRAEEQPRQADVPSQVAADASLAKRFAGAWRWKVSGMNSARPADSPVQDSMLLLQEFDGRIRGVSTLEVPVRSVAGGGDMVSLIALSLNGSVRTENGKPVIEFEVRDAVSGRKTVSTAVLSEDGKQLHGMSETDTGSTGSGNSSSIRYTWTAAKVTYN